ncbi:MAG TPA: DUF1287 domain-containing protein [Methylotenera sp.]|nr:DUF1287 domain-containing protein [Methylotenera sp.]HPH06060.1 DUF1287 domain-containing protein [Methylotenera sp.]HPN00933.1 DUF1287 domain-containing protein [Methylotenera sp.]
MFKVFLIVCMLTFAQFSLAEDLKLVEAARKQIGVTKSYDPQYTKLAYPNGDVDRSKGVCTDVVIRALREAHQIDLQKLVHEDMAENFRLYPKNWGLKKTDKNIDHRRVPNLQIYFKRHWKSLAITQDVAQYQAGDVVTVMLPGNLPHIMLVSDAKARGFLTNNEPLVIHNIGRGTKEEASLLSYQITGHFRKPE